MVILCTIDLETREVSLPAGQVIASYDHNVDVIRFQAEAIPGFSLNTSTIKIAAQGPNKSRHDYAVDPSTVAIEEETGYITFDWPIPQGVTEMPLDVFKYGDKGNLIFAVCAEIISGDTVSKAWHSDDGIITVVAHLEPEAGGGEDPEEEATNRQMIGQLQTDVAVVQREVSAVAGGAPTVVDSKSAMTEHDKIYILSSDGKWYYYSATAEDWLVGGTYGGAVTDSTLSIEGRPADAKATGDALALKADSSDVTALDTRVTAVEGDVDDLKEDLSVVVESAYLDITDDIVWNVDGYYNGGVLVNMGEPTTPQDTETAKTSFFTVNGGERFRVSGHSHYLQKLFCIYGTNDSMLGIYAPGKTSTDYTDEVIDIPSNAVKVGISYYKASYLANFKLEKLEQKRKQISAEDAEFFGDVITTNLYNYADAVDGKYIEYNDGTITTRSDMSYVYVPISSGNYVVTVSKHFFGNNAQRVPYFDASKSYLGYIQGLFMDSTPPVLNLAFATITVPNNAKYIGISVRKTYKNRAMVVSGSTKPTSFKSYFASYSALEDEEKVKASNVKGGVENTLYLKTVAFDGDSICHGISANDGKNGWAGRIGNANEMNWVNYGVSGGTITNNHSHCILNTLEDIHAYLPTLDYYIFEGGTNDADVLGDEGIGTLTADDFGGTYDTSTFTGAFETLIYNVLTYYPQAKVGYIVAQKMGKTNNANYRDRKTYFARAKDICEKWGIPYIDLWDGSHLNPNLTSMYDSSLGEQGNRDAGKMYIDGQHLTNEGYEYITPIIEAWMRTL